ncbi:MAG: outer membrane lipoprotein-sorting protein [Myxococcota bacterium]
MSTPSQRHRRPPLFLPIAILLGFALSGKAEAEDLAEVRACEAKVPGRTSVVSLELRSVDRTGGTRTLAGKMRWKLDDEGRSQTLIELEKPPDVRGSAYLLHERESTHDMWVFLPAVAKVRRIHPRSASGRLFGTDFSYDDIARLQGLAVDGKAERLPDALLGGRAVYRVRARLAPEEGSGFARVEYFMDRETCLPLQIEFYGEGGALQKVMRGDPASVERAGSGWVLRSVRIQDLANGTESLLVVSGIQVDVDLPDGLFSLTNLQQRQ